MNELGPTSFEDGVSAIMVMTEELKRSTQQQQEQVTTDQIVIWQMDLDSITQKLDFLLRLTLDSPGDQVRNDLFGHVANRAVETALVLLQHVTNSSQDNGQVFDSTELQGHGALARIAEFNLIVIDMMQQPQQDENNDQKRQKILDIYTNYQRQLLRQRCKPAIAQLATWRKNPQLQQPQQEDDDPQETQQQQQPHVHAITVILGQGSALLHPLVLWNQQVPPDSPISKMCTSAISTLDEQAQTLTKTVCDWFHVDRKVEDLMSKTADNDEASQNDLDAAALDAVLEEMSFVCQVLARYEVLIQGSAGTIQTIVSQELLPEWTWRYAALERYLSTQQWKSALKLACPVDIVMGTCIKVPSVVEDAQYLSTKALERASSTLSIQAMGTVAHAVTHDVWSTDGDGNSGVYEALIQQYGCWAPPPEETSQDAKAKSPQHSGNASSNTFASALLDAFDDDLGPDKSKSTTNNKTPSNRPPSAPSSGGAGLLGGLVGSLAGGQQQQQQIRLDTQLCNLNGIHSASVACSSLVTLLENLLQDNAENETNSNTSAKSSTSIIELAREELERYGKAYETLLNNMVQQVLAEWCGSMTRGQDCLLALKEFFNRELYELDATSFRRVESDDRLEQDMIRPLRNSPIVMDLERKCDTHVTALVCRELSSMISNLVLEILWKDQPPQERTTQLHGPKRFNDWGSLLLSKQIRLLSQFVVNLVETSSSQGNNESSSYNNTAMVNNQWENLSQVVTILQLEKPLDFHAYQSTCGLSVTQLDKTLRLRVDFSSDAILATTQAYQKSKEQQHE